MSLNYRIEEFHFHAGPKHGEEWNDDCLSTSITIPPPDNISGTFYLKVLSIDGFLDLYSLRHTKFNLDFLPSTTHVYSANQVVKMPSESFMTVPSLYHEKMKGKRDISLEISRAFTQPSPNHHIRYEEEIEGGACMIYKRVSKHSHGEDTTLQKNYSVDHIDESKGLFSE